MRRVEHAITIDAPASSVWEVLTETDRYEQWNPFITHFGGRLAEGDRLTLTVHPGSREMSFQPTVLAVQEERIIRWRGRLGMRGIFDGDHELLLGPLDSGATRFTQRETFTGVLVPFLGAVLEDTAAGFAAMNAALRDRVVHRVTTSTDTKPL